MVVPAVPPLKDFLHISPGAAQQGNAQVGQVYVVLGDLRSKGMSTTNESMKKERLSTRNESM